MDFQSGGMGKPYYASSIAPKGSVQDKLGEETWRLDNKIGKTDVDEVDNEEGEMVTPRFPSISPRPQPLDDEKTMREPSHNVEEFKTRLYGGSYLWDIEGFPTEFTIRPKDGLTLDDGAWKSQLLTTKELDEKLKENPKYLMQRVCKGEASSSFSHSLL